MPPGVLALVAVAAVLHASWNVILKGSGDPLATAVRAMVGSSFVAVPVAVGGWLVAGGPTIPPVAWACGIASGALEGIYFALLASACGNDYVPAVLTTGVAVITYEAWRQNGFTGSA